MQENKRSKYSLCRLISIDIKFFTFQFLHSVAFVVNYSWPCAVELSSIVNTLMRSVKHYWIKYKKNVRNRKGIHSRLFTASMRWRDCQKEVTERAQSATQHLRGRNSEEITYKLYPINQRHTILMISQIARRLVIFFERSRLPFPSIFN